MFAISVRVSPCNARSSPRSVGRVTVISPSDCSIFIRAGTCCDSSPRGPLTITRPGRSETLTPLGSSMGFLPIRLMTFRSAKALAVVLPTYRFYPNSSDFRLRKSPDEAQDFAADSLLLRGSARDESARRGQDRHAHPAEHARQAVLARVHTAARLRHALQVGDDPLATPAVLQLDDQVIEALALLDAVILD